MSGPGSDDFGKDSSEPRCKRCQLTYSMHNEATWTQVICGEETACSGRKCPDGKGSYVIAAFTVSRRAVHP
jgi:hypothetical protein